MLLKRQRMFITRHLFALLGWTFFGIGLVGTVVPLLPTTIFWIIATWFFSYGCPWMTSRIYAMGPIGRIIEQFNMRVFRLFKRKE